MTLTREEQKLYDFVVYTAEHHSQGGWSMGPSYFDICCHMGLDRIAARQMVDILEAKGYVSYPRDKRGHRVMRMVDW